MFWEHDFPRIGLGYRAGLMPRYKEMIRLSRKKKLINKIEVHSGLGLKKLICFAYSGVDFVNMNLRLGI